jgi:hypothetical protein
MMSFRKELQTAGFVGEPREFYRLVAELLTETGFGMTDEQLKRNPRLALQFCDTVRDRTGLLGLTDPLILGALENGRKQKVRPAGFSDN